MLEANNINEKGDKFESDFLKNNLEIRSYQIKISDKCINNNSLVVLPTGLGKTIIAIIVAAKTLDNYPPTSKIIVLAPTRPLIDQHFRIFGKHLKISEEKLCILTGNIKPENRIDLFNKNQFLFYTPQTLRNDLVNRRYTLKNVCLIIFDECHHAFGNYPYTFIADEYNDQNPDGTILALTASPGASKERIRKLCYNLHIPLQNIYKRMREDTDVRIYIKDLEIIKIGVKPTDLMERFYEILRLMIEERLKYLSQLNFIEVKSEKLFYRITRKDLINLNKKLVNTLNSNAEKAGSYSAISVNAQILILYHMIELIEQQGLDILMCYLEEMNKKAKKNNSSKAIKMLANENRLRQIYILLKKSQETTPENLIHPKYKVLEQL
ncbi:MAG: DEAD/DEAH box helicase, partial [Candidatus Hermodarchaeota archaeon]